MNKKFDRSQLISAFRVETLEHVHALNQGILALEKNSKDQGLMESLLRTAHTLKGSSVIAGFKRIADLAHSFEDALGRIREGRLNLTEEHFNLLFRLLDSIPPLLERKISWEEKGVAFPHVLNLESSLNAAFGLKGQPPSSEPAEKGPPPPQLVLERSGDTIRVGVEKLDDLVNLAGELATNRINFNQNIENLSGLLAEMDELGRNLAAVGKDVGQEVIDKSDRIRGKLDLLEKGLSSTARGLDLVNSDLQESIMKTRMLPLSSLFNVFPRSVRDLSKKEGKSIIVDIRGGETEVDRSILQVMENPMMHLIRNAVAHGIEKPEERKAGGKPEGGTITLKAYQQGGLVVIEVSDDGKGIRPEEIRKRAVELGVVTEAESKQMSHDQVLQLLFAPGFTTQNVATQESGRGIGLDVVRDHVERLKGHLEVASEPGKYAKFTLKLPLTLAISSALMIKSCGQVFAIPLTSLEETLRITSGDIGSIETQQVIQVRDKIIPLARLDELLNLEKKGIIERKHRSVVVVRAIEKQLALVVDEFLGKRDIVIKTLGDHLAPGNNIAGSTILGTGEVSLILDIPALIETAATIAGRPAAKPRSAAPGSGASILIVEDSNSTAQSERLILQSAGYTAAVARNGREALEKMAKRKPDLVLTDIAMPILDGFGLVSRMKKDDHYKDIPIIIVSSKDDEADRRKGAELGANAYISKSSFNDATLLDAVAKLIG